MNLKRIISSIFLFSATFSIFLSNNEFPMPDRMSQSSDNAPKDHHEYLAHLGIEDLHEEKHYGSNNGDDEYDYYHHHDHHNLGIDKLHNHLHKNSKKLKEIEDLLKNNKIQNNSQDAMLKQQSQMINKQLSMQEADAQRDAVAMDMQKAAANQRNSISDAVMVNNDMLKVVQNGQGVLADNQGKMLLGVGYLKNSAGDIKNLVQNNGGSLTTLVSKVDGQNLALANQAKNMKAHMESVSYTHLTLPTKRIV